MPSNKNLFRLEIFCLDREEDEVLAAFRMFELSMDVDEFTMKLQDSLAEVGIQMCESCETFKAVDEMDIAKQVCRECS